MLEPLGKRYPAVWPWIRLMRLDRPIGTMLLMWPTLWAVWIAGEGTPSLKTVVVFILGVIVMRAAGCVINDYADRDFDGHVSRTTDRPLATGEISARGARFRMSSRRLGAAAISPPIRMPTEEKFAKPQAA